MATTAGSSNRDFVKIAVKYAESAIADKKGKKHGLLIRQAAKRFSRDLKRAKRKRKPPFIFDEWHANDVCDFIEKLPHVEGVWDHPDIILHESHIFFLVQLFGFRTHEGGRRYTSALFAVARKNAKSTLASAILLYCFCCEDEPGAQIISAATTYDQAAIIFKVAKAMAARTPDLREAFGLECWAKAMSRDEIGGTFKALHAKASTQDGLNPSHVGLDEIHAHKDSDLINVLTSAAGARRNPLWLYTTTEGYTNAGPWSEIRHFAKQILKGVLKDTADHFLAIFYAIDEKDTEFDESAWIKANPLMTVNPNLKDAIRKEAVEAQQMPSKLAEFKIKRLNRPASSAESWIDLRKWKKCAGEVDLERLRRVPCYAGLDLASVSDLTSFRLLWELDGHFYTYGYKWVPKDAVKQRTERGTVKYDKWISGGWMNQTEGEVTDYSVIEAAIVAANEEFNIQGIGYDKWNAQDLVNRLIATGLPMIEFAQTTDNYHPAMQMLERKYCKGELSHGADPVLNWCGSNLIVRRGANMNMAPDKKKAADKIDDMCSLLMAVGISQVDPEPDLDEFLNNAVIA